MEFQQYPVTIMLIAANVIFSIIGFSNNAFLEKTILWPYEIKRKQQYYRLITSGFLHADWMHLFFNMFTLYFFGRAIEMYFSGYGLGGNISYLLLYFGALVVSDISTLSKHQNNYYYKALGASGAVSAVVFGAILFNPWTSIYLYGAIKLSAMLYAALFLTYCVYMGKKGADNINHDAHLWGSIFGLVFTVLLIMLLQPQLLEIILDKLKDPSIFGN
jgi:membrane associated rhomboid family serine protease